MENKQKGIRATNKQKKKNNINRKNSVQILFCLIFKQFKIRSGVVQQCIPYYIGN